MKVNISDIVKTDGASLDIEFKEYIPDLNSGEFDFIFENPVEFKGQLMSLGGVIKLNGCLKADYKANCYRCLQNVHKDMELTIEENFVESEKNTDNDVYTYEGNYLTLDKPLKDNILLNLPMKQICSEDCKGLCPKCGVNHNFEACDCKEDEINPGMEVLKNFFKD